MVLRRHDVYWGTHGCERLKGHANPCLCNCKTALPEDHNYVYGDDVDTAVRKPERNHNGQNL